MSEDETRTPRHLVPVSEGFLKELEATTPEFDVDGTPPLPRLIARQIRAIQERERRSLEDQARIRRDRRLERGDA